LRRVGNLLVLVVHLSPTHESVGRFDVLTVQRFNALRLICG
jgi:hypothetical protein